MEKPLIVLAILAFGYVAYTIARRARSKGGHGAGGKPGDRDAL